MQVNVESFAAVMNEKWTFPSPCAMDNIATFMLRERLVGFRFLRQLNKHWCLHLDTYVVSIRPHKTRKLGLENLASLHKFPNLRVLNIAPFIQFLPSSPNVNDFVLAALVQRTHLRHLEATAGNLKTLENYLSRLIQIRSLKVTGAFVEGMPDLDVLSLEYLQIELGSQVLQNLQKTFSRLNELEICFLKTVSHVEAFDWASLNHLKALHLRFNASIESLSFLSNVSSLVSIILSNPISQADIDILSQMPILKKLSISVKEITSLQSPSFFQILDKLHHLSLICNPQETDTEPVYFACHPVSLQSLHLLGFFIADPSIMRNFARLKSLLLTRCTFPDDGRFLSLLPHLEKLGLDDCKMRTGIFNIVPRIGESCPNMKTLIVPCSSQNLRYLCLLPKLERLCLFVVDFYKYEDRQFLKQLTNVRDLGLIAGMQQNIRRLLDLEWIHQLESLHINSTDIQSVAENYATRLKTRSPFLKVEFYHSHYEDRDVYGCCLFNED